MKRCLCSVVLVLSLVVVSESCAEGPHLFILSGQSNMNGLKPEVSFTPTVTKLLAPDDVIVVKDSQGGQPIRRWFKEWKSPSGEKPANNGDLYDRLMTKVNKAIAGKKIASVTFVWMQGERDSRENLHTVYKASLEGLVQQLESDLKRDDINVVVGRLSDCKGRSETVGWKGVRAAQEAYAKENDHVTVVDTDDLNGEKDDLHYTKEGYAELGRRFAKAGVELMSEGSACGSN